jgi:Arc/MetJ-type ribon-helix-helix transcriptional regulator
MRRTTVTIPDELEAALDQYLQDQGVALQQTAVIQAAIRAYLQERGYLAPASPLRIRPAERGSGKPDTSTDHDRYLATK